MTGRFWAALAAMVASLAAVLAVAAAPQAAAHPEVTWLNCESGASLLICDVAYTNSYGPVTIRWYVNGTHRAAGDDSTFLRTGCVVGQGQNVQVVLTDLAGSTTAYGGTACRRVGL